MFKKCLISWAAFGLWISSAIARPLFVVTTIPDLAAIAAYVGGDVVTVRSIAQGHEDPHFLQARPAFVIQARQAELWIRAGMELEMGWEPVLLESARNPRILPGAPGFLDLSEHIPVILDVPQEKVTRAQGDVHPSGNPHYLLDPRNARAAAWAIGRKLAELRPEHTKQFEEGAQRFVREIDERMFGSRALAHAEGDELWDRLEAGTLETWLRDRELAAEGWYGRAARRGRRPIVTFHKSFTYAAHRFGIEVAAHLEPVPGVPPSPAHLTRVIATMRANGVDRILMEPFYPRKPAEFVAERTGARVIVVSTYAPDIRPDAWFRMMETIVDALTAE